MVTRLMRILSNAVAALAITVTGARAGGPKRTAEVCNDGNECSRSHCLGIGEVVIDHSAGLISGVAPTPFSNPFYDHRFISVTR